MASRVEGEWVRMFVNRSKESREAYDILVRAGAYVTTIIINNIPKPEARIDRDVYKGLEEITKLCKQAT